jgi:pimeloyl-ACP methyl ester carboxylesterase
MIPTHLWREKGRYVDTPDGRLWAMEMGNGGVPVLALHGFPTSSWDFAEAIERIARTRRVVTFDFFGFGFSAKPAELGYSIFEQADAAELVARAFGVQRAHVWAHDMGTSVATELCARRERGLLPFSMASLTLMNGSVHIELAQLTIGQRILKTPLGPLFAKLSTRRSFKLQIRRVFAKPPSEAELDAMWDLVQREDGAARLPQIIRYTEERARFRRRWIGALERLDLPALVAWGRKDPVAVLAIAEQLAREIPGAAFETWDDLGHYPQVEDPARVVATVEKFWNSHDT